jgi:sortase A
MSKNKSNFSKLGLGVALVILGIILISGRNQIATNLGTSFADEPVEVSGFDNFEVASDKIPNKIIIPDLSVDIAVKRAQIKGGYWEVFPDSAGWGEGSGIPGQPGNQVIFAHAREGLFLPLKKTEIGMKIYVFTESDWYSYEVVEMKEVLPNQTEVIEETEDERLTLYTCSGFTDSKRLIVVAKRV